MIAFILGCYNKIDDLLCHIDIIKHYPFDYKIIVIYMGGIPDHLEKLKHVNVVNVSSHGFLSGPLLCLTNGIKEAFRLGCDYLCYRNADDWLFNYHFVKNNFDQLRNGVLCMGYNWFSVNSFMDFALNEIYLHVETFHDIVNEMEYDFLYGKKLLCEFKIAKWFQKFRKGFYRLPERERFPGIGHVENIDEIFVAKNIIKPNNFLDIAKTNNRFFNKKWQLIGSHNNLERLFYWQSIQNDVEYASDLVKCTSFIRWFDAATLDKSWNFHIPQIPLVKEKIIKKKILRKLL